jgi:hypothetical protein
MFDKTLFHPIHSTTVRGLHFWIMVCVLFLSRQLAAQAPSTPIASTPTFQTGSGDVPGQAEPLQFTHAQTPEKSELVTDSLPDAAFRMYDPARQSPIDYGTIGNIGSAARPLLYEVAPLRGFSNGIDVFELYTLKPNDLRFYRNKRAFSDAFFSQGKNNLSSMLNAKFARTFEGGLNVSLDYRSINNNGEYNYQRDKHNALSGGFWLSRGKHYDGFLIFTKNVVRQEENGGIVSDDVFTGNQFQGPLAAAIRLPEERAYTRYDEQGIQLTQHYRFTGGAEGKRALRATHTLAWGQKKYKFSDGDTVRGLRNDTTYFNSFRVDDRGIRNFFRENRIDNTFTLNTFKSKKSGAPTDLLAVGLAHSYIRLSQEPNNYSINNLFFTADLNFRPSDRFVFSANSALGLLGNIGEYQLQGALTVGLGKAGQLSASLLSQRRPPSLLQRRLFVSKRAVWDNTFDKPVENTLSLTYSLPVIGLEATARTTLLNNYVFFDQMSRPSQTTSPLQVLQVILKEQIKFGWFHFDNTVALQQANRSDVFRLPNWFSKNSLYATSNFFKKRLLLTMGIDFRVNSGFQPDGYNPLIGQFYLQDSVTQKPYPWVDVFLAFKVQSFRFAVRYENCSTWWDNTQVFYQTLNYPQPFGGIRLSVGWRFMDGNQKETTQNSGGGQPNLGGIGIRGKER